MAISLVLQGTFFTAQTATAATFQEQALICIDSTGLIDHIVPLTSEDYSLTLTAAKQSHRLVQLLPNQYILPGFIDLHIHAPQWPQAGSALDRPLNEWLAHDTFPLEARFADSAYAQHVYQDLVSELLANGTTTAVYFGSRHSAANLVLAQACADHGQRGFIGQVTMDNPDQTPADYRDPSSAAALQEAEHFITDLQRLSQTTGAALTPVITPRFVPSCTPDTLRGLGELARRYDLPVQSHCSESDWEDHYAIEHYGQRDAEVLDHFGLLRPHSVMAHGTHLTTSDLILFARRHTAVAHCPISNAYFGNAVFPVKRALEHHVNVGLGSDPESLPQPTTGRHVFPTPTRRCGCAVASRATGSGQ